MKSARVLWFVEHLAREFDVACAVKCLAESLYPLDIRIRNIYMHAREVLRWKEPRIVVHPFFYFAEGALGTEHYVKAWPRALHFNLAWEELFYSANARIKGPSDEFARRRVLHHAWGPFYRRFLLDHGVPPEHIFTNGNPAYQLYKPPYRSAAPSREELAGRHGIDPGATWIFIPENYRWAFTSDQKLRRIADSQEHLGELGRMKEHCVQSLRILLGWSNRLAGSPGTAIIFRPRPATSTSRMRAFLEETVERRAPGFHLLKEGTVREWILASDVVMSSFSTSLIEASIAEKPIYMIEPLPLPEGLHSSWYAHVDRLASEAEFARAGLEGRGKGNWRRLSDWAHAEMLAKGDPIRGLADILGGLAKGGGDFADLAPPPGALGRFRRWLESRRARILGRRSIQANPDTHEGDQFTDRDIEARVALWRKILLDGG